MKRAVVYFLDSRSRLVNILKNFKFTSLVKHSNILNEPEKNYSDNYYLLPILTKQFNMFIFKQITLTGA